MQSQLLFRFGDEPPVTPGLSLQLFTPGEDRQPALNLRHGTEQGTQKDNLVVLNQTHVQPIRGTPSAAWWGCKCDSISRCPGQEQEIYQH